MSLGMFLHALHCCTAIGVSLHQWFQYWHLEVYDIHIGVGLRRCSFRQTGQFSGASNREASDSAGLHVFFMPEKWICKTLVISSPISNNGRLGLAMVVEWN